MIVVIEVLQWYVNSCSLQEHSYRNIAVHDYISIPGVTIVCNFRY